MPDAASHPEGTKEYPYVQLMNVLYGPLEKIDVNALADACTHQWYNQTLCQVDESVVRVAVIRGEYHWHHHENEDEFFFVVSGKLLMDLEGRTVELLPGNGILVPKGAEHRPRAPERTVVLMVEKATIDPKGS
jgi:mannose-6-phosphate isomerase-like protein (cupin superfamily)